MKLEFDCPDWLVEYIEGVAERPGADVSRVVVGAVLDATAREIARMNSFGYEPRLLVEFSAQDPAELYMVLRAQWDDYFKRQTLGTYMLAAATAPTPEARAMYEGCIAKMRAPVDAQLGRMHTATRDRLDAGDRLKAEQDAGRVPGDYSGDPLVALDWLAECDRGEITAEQLAERFEAHKNMGGWPSGG